VLSQLIYNELNLKANNIVKPSCNKVHNLSAKFTRRRRIYPPEEDRQARI